MFPQRTLGRVSPALNQIRQDSIVILLIVGFQVQSVRHVFFARSIKKYNCFIMLAPSASYEDLFVCFGLLEETDMCCAWFSDESVDHRRLLLMVRCGSCLL